MCVYACGVYRVSDVWECGTCPYPCMCVEVRGWVSGDHPVFRSQFAIELLGLQTACLALFGLLASDLELNTYMERHLPIPLGHSRLTYLGGLFRCRYWFSEFGVGPELCALVIMKSVLLIHLLHLSNTGTDHFSEALMSYIKCYRGS